MKRATTFEVKARYIFVPLLVVSKGGKLHEFDAVLDTGAPFTEISDRALQYAGFIEPAVENIEVKPGLYSQKYDSLVLPCIEICQQRIQDFKIYVSRFEEDWGIDALIGLDFFRHFLTTIDYGSGLILTEPVNRR
jgi:hypothetical protein